MKNLSKLLVCLLIAVGTTSCWILTDQPRGGGPFGGGFVATTPDFRVELMECIGNHSAQTASVTIMVTNRNANQRAWIGGSSQTYAIDDQGLTSRPHSSAGVSTELPTGVPVRVTIERIGPLFNTRTLRHLQISIGNSEQNRVTFKNVPIVWE